MSETFRILTCEQTVSDMMETWKVRDQYKHGYDQSSCKPETLYAFQAKITTDIYVGPI